VAGGTVYVGAGDGFLYAFRGAGCGRSTCAPLWRGFPINGVVAGTYASPAVAGGVVYFAANNERVGAFDARGCGQPLCEALWFFITDDSIVNSPVIVNGRLYVAGSNFGSLPVMYVFKPV
jgi:outer membrane protein assembly factor BamB